MRSTVYDLILKARVLVPVLGERINGVSSCRFLDSNYYVSAEIHWEFRGWRETWAVNGIRRAAPRQISGFRNSCASVNLIIGQGVAG